MKPYIYGERNGIHIIDLRQTLAQIEAAAAYLKDLTAKGGTVLFVGTKKQAQAPIAEAAKSAGMPYVNFRWLGGMLTKRERLSISRELSKLQQTLGGVRDMTKTPDAIFIVDVNTEHTAVKEAARLGITTLALVDSNCDPDHIDFVIAGNDDAIRAASVVAGALAEACREGKGAVPKEAELATEEAASG
jgi:small subunit ribosomal protein S2